MLVTFKKAPYVTGSLTVLLVVITVVSVFWPSRPETLNQALVHELHEAIVLAETHATEAAQLRKETEVLKGRIATLESRAPKVIVRYISEASAGESFNSPNTVAWGGSNNAFAGSESFGSWGSSTAGDMGSCAGYNC